MILCTVSVSMAVLVLNLHNRSPDAYTMPTAVSCYALMIWFVVVLHVVLVVAAAAVKTVINFRYFGKV